jgi:hypothetical protein
MFAAGLTISADQQRQNGPSTAVTVRPISPDAINGVWDYNDALSVDAATGRPERAPRSATQRALGTPAPAGTAPGGGGRAGGGRGGGGGGGGAEGMGSTFDQARRAMAAVIAAERRTYVRDLLEVPEQLTIRASSEEVTFVDDLDRLRTYAADGRVQRLQLSAARFEAKSSWSETYFRKEIEGTNNFKMSETYFVSDDGSRLFVIIRIGDPKKPETLAGVNRVYDRVRSGLPN